MGTAAVEVRLLSYNVRSLRDDIGALARVIRACAPDVVCVQEAPRFLGWRRRAECLGRAAGLVHVVGGASTCGTMIMTTLRPRVERSEEVLLPFTPGLHRRGLAAAVLRFGAAARLGVVSCHLGLWGEERYQHSALLLEHVSGLGAPGVVAGDINERPHGRAFQRLTGQLQDAWATAPDGGEHTYPATAPQRRIDAVLCTSGVEVVGCGVPYGLPGVAGQDLREATDHLPVLATLRLPERPRRLPQYPPEMAPDTAPG